MSSHRSQAKPQASMQATRASRISEAEWNARRQRLENLYLGDSLSQQEILETMAREDNFFATEKQLKYQFNKWGLKKYISDRDLTTMLSFKRKRQEVGKDTAFVYRGHLFEQERLERASKRRKGPLMSSPVLPPYIEALVSPRQSPRMTSLFPAQRQISAAPDGVEAATHNCETPVSRNLLSNEFSHQSGSFGWSDIWNSLGAFSDPAILHDGEQNQADSGLWETLLENNSVSSSPRRGSRMPTPSRREFEAPPTENISPLMQQRFNMTPYIPDAQIAHDNDFSSSDFDLDFDFSMFENRSHRSSRARSSSFHEESHPRITDERMSISPRQLTNLKDTHGEVRGHSLVPRTSSPAGQSLDPVTGDDVRAESIASLLGLLKFLVLPRFNPASQKFEYAESILSEFFCPRWCEWLCFEVEELLDSYLERSLRATRKRRAARLQGTLPSGSDLFHDESGQAFEFSDGIEGLPKPVDGTGVTKLRKTFSRRFPTPMGLVVFEVREAPSCSMDDGGINSNSRITISFMPRTTERTLGLCAQFYGLVDRPAISRHINTFNVIPDDSAIFQCISMKDLKGIQTLFDLGAASARDVDSRGTSLLQYAMFSGSSDIFRLLLHGGASTYECDISGRTVDVITAIWTFFAKECIIWRCSKSTQKMHNFEHCVAITQLALDNGCAVDSAYDDSIITPSPLFVAPLRNNTYCAVVNTINYLHSIGWDLEEQNCLGQTPLLYAATECHPHIARRLKTLIERGARLEARDLTGRGPLHSALSPPKFLPDWEDEDEEDEGNIDWLSCWWRTEDHRYAEDYYNRESTLDSRPDLCRSTPSLDAVGSNLNRLVYNPESNMSPEHLMTTELSSSDTGGDASSYTESIPEVHDDDEYVYCRSEWSGKKAWIRNPVHVLKDRVRTKLRILLEAGCDPNDLDYNGKSSSDYARKGLWPQWLWALERTGYVFDGEQDRWIKRIGPA